MSLRCLEVHAEHGHADTIRAAAEHHGAIDVFAGPTGEDGRQMLRILVGAGSQQPLLDNLQSILSGTRGWRVVIVPVEAALPKTPAEDGEATQAEQGKPILPQSKWASREELYEDIKAGTRLDRAFLVLTALSTLVAAIGMARDNLAVIIGAMVIAPLLGPNLAFVFGSAIADRKLIGLSMRTNAVGFGLSLAISVALGFFWPEALIAEEFRARANVGYAEVALALASGAAAVLSLTTGLSAALVGVMVAVALLPPAVALGMSLGGGRFDLAIGAALLLAVNVVCINLAAQLVFLARRLGPRTWIERKNARVYVAVNILIWLVALAIFSALIAYR